MGLSLSIISPQTHAESEDECAIWLCLPAGFPAGCEKAYSAMIKRITRWKPLPPLPAFAACAISNPDAKDEEKIDPEEFSYTYRRVIIFKDGSIKLGNSCWVRSGSGRDATQYYIPNCITSKREIKVFQKGKLIGNPYYF